MTLGELVSQIIKIISTYVTIYLDLYDLLN